MDQHTYAQFTQTLHERLVADDRVLGLIALGSMADPLRRDQWSDHDFWVITQTGAQEYFLTDLSWLPNAQDIILPFRQGTQYYTVLYRTGHSVEFAVFDRDQMQHGKTERYDVLFDKATIAADMQRIHAQTITSVRAAHDAVSDTTICNYFFLQLLVGVQRHVRGEVLSSQTYIAFLAVDNLLSLIHRYIPPQHPTMRDTFDTRRHFERRYPAIAQEIRLCLTQASPAAALGLLDIADKRLAAGIPRYPQDVADVTREAIRSAIEQPHVEDR
jgi:hypothetical protein